MQQKAGLYTPKQLETHTFEMQSHAMSIRFFSSRDSALGCTFSRNSIAEPAPKTDNLKAAVSANQRDLSNVHNQAEINLPAEASLYLSRALSPQKLSKLAPSIDRSVHVLSLRLARDKYNTRVSKNSFSLPSFQLNYFSASGP